MKYVTPEDNFPECFDLASQRVTDMYRKNRGELFIDRICTDCGLRVPVLVRGVRDAIKKGRVPVSKCQPCATKGRIKTSSGYIIVLSKGHPNASAKGYVPEHRLVMESMIGRYLTSDETVHHIDGDRANNKEENLQLRQGNHGSGVARSCGDCGSHNIINVPLAEPVEVVDLVSA